MAPHVVENGADQHSAFAHLQANVLTRFREAFIVRKLVEEFILNLDKPEVLQGNSLVRRAAELTGSLEFQRLRQNLQFIRTELAPGEPHVLELFEQFVGGHIQRETARARNPARPARSRGALRTDDAGHPCSQLDERLPVGCRQR